MQALARGSRVDTNGPPKPLPASTTPPSSRPHRPLPPSPATARPPARRREGEVRRVCPEPVPEIYRGASDTLSVAASPRAKAAPKEPRDGAGLMVCAVIGPAPEAGRGAKRHLHRGCESRG